MKRMIVWPTTAIILGFLAFVAIFHLAIAQRPIPQPEFVYIFSLMAAVPLGVLAAVLAAFQILRDELALLRREFERLRKLEQLLAPTSTQFKASPSERFPHSRRP